MRRLPFFRLPPSGGPGDGAPANGPFPLKPPSRKGRPSGGKKFHVLCPATARNSREPLLHNREVLFQTSQVHPRQEKPNFRAKPKVSCGPFPPRVPSCSGWGR